MNSVIEAGLDCIDLVLRLRPDLEAGMVEMQRLREVLYAVVPGTHVDSAVDRILHSVNVFLEAES